ncbi:surface antigen-like protein [Leptomonas pyrrhocoris]|uniref:Surface antigen-like protein n=1 Tax=Leptomonas pyrrhocoris TaxID=157538 RepID=A0A0N0VE74_LEPPY|nr:surface antigen-like protein [Leptomonas pyrrhocoris]KPA77552.1 surface antigen-like protein [Leptomonas pyrrhocoris]|eukprot:XP_015655991.1 surface antigen-like protein [Leptomonas pyrrhocoris]
MPRILLAALIAAVALLFIAAAQPAFAEVTPAQQSSTRAFLREFAREIPYLQNRWVGTDYCGWEGITCDASGNVAIDLAGKDLVGDMPELDSDVDGWQVMVMSIDMSNNPRWSDEFEEDWAGLHNLRFLNLSYTALHDAIPDSWNGMRALEEVHISHTSACKSLPEWTLTTLHTIDLSHNNLQGALSAAWSQMTGLTSVDITGNGFCGCVPSTWTSALLSDAAAAAGGAVRSATCATDNACTYAKLWCVNAPITTATPTRPPGPTTTTTTPNPSFTSAATLAFLREFAREIPYLQNRWVGTDYCGWEGITCDASGYVSVDLAGKDLTGDMPELRSDVDGSQVMVVSIDMSNNPRWSDEFEEDWAGLKVLQHLDLSRTGLYGAIPDAWNGMVSLQTVKISNTYACLGLPNWNIASLRTIDLSNNKLTGNLVSSWGRMTGLTSVDISGNNFCGCLPHEWTSALLVNAATAANRELTSATCYSTRFCTPDDYVCDTTTPTTVPDVVCSVQHCLSCYPGFPNLCQECSSGYNVRADGSCMPSGECAVEHCVQCALASSTRCIQCDEGYVTTRTGTCQRARNGAAAPASVLVAVAAVVVALAAAAYGA